MVLQQSLGNTCNAAGALAWQIGRKLKVLRPFRVPRSALDTLYGPWISARRQEHADTYGDTVYSGDSALELVYSYRRAEVEMIDLEKVITWFCIFAGVWLAMFISHTMTMQAVRKELAEMVIPMHEPVVADPYFPLPRLNGPDSLAYCINMVDQMKAGTR